MKIVAKDIEMIAWFKNLDMPIPIKFRILNSDGNQTVKVDRVIQVDEEKLAGNRMYLYRCQSMFGNIQKPYELKYEIDKCKWILFKI